MHYEFLLKTLHLKNKSQYFLKKKYNKTLQQTSATLQTATVAENDLSRHAPDVVIIIPRKLRPGADIIHREKRDPREPKIVRVDEHVLDENVRTARVLR